MIFLVAGALGLPVFLLLVGALRQRTFADVWELLLTPRGVEHYREMKARLEDDLAVYDATQARASRLRRLGSFAEAMRLMREGCLLIEWTTPDRLKQLAGMALLTRLVFALAPVRPLRPLRFRLRQLSTVAGLAWLLHHFLVGAAERLRLRLLVLGCGFRLVARLLRRSARHLHVKDPSADSAWAQLGTLRADYGSLSEEALESFRTILLGISAEPKAVVLARDF